MKWILILLNLGAAVGIIFAGAMICYIQEVHGYSTFVELQQHGLLTNSASQKGPAAGSIDVEERLKSIGSLGAKLPPLTYVAAAIFVLNAVTLFVVWKKPAPSPPPSR
jgi:hypothetical protein